jgi:hypothetical protein
MDKKPVPVTNTEDNGFNKTTIAIMIGVVMVGACALVFLAFTWFRPNAGSLIAEYFPSPTPTRQPTATLAPTRTPAPDLTATQQAWVKPAELPSLGNAEDVRSTLDEDFFFYLEVLASAFPETPEINQPGDVYVYEIQLDESIPLVWSYGWCTTTQSILEDNFSHIQLDFVLNEASIPSNVLATRDYQRDDGAACREVAALVQSWTSRGHTIWRRSSPSHKPSTTAGTYIPQGRTPTNISLL